MNKFAALPLPSSVTRQHCVGKFLYPRHSNGLTELQKEVDGVEHVHLLLRCSVYGQFSKIMVPF